MTRYVFAYDLEDPDLCLRAAPRLVELLMRYAQGMAATTYGGLYHAYSALDR